MEGKWFSTIVGSAIFAFALVNSLGITEKGTVFFLLWVVFVVGTGIFYQTLNDKKDQDR